MRKALLILFYYAVFTPLAWVLRRFHDVLDQEWDARRVTYFDLPPDSPTLAWPARPAPPSR